MILTLSYGCLVTFNALLLTPLRVSVSSATLLCIASLFDLSEVLTSDILSLQSTHAFALPTFYLPSAVDESRTASIPNAISDVCSEIDKVRSGYFGATLS